MGSKYSVKFKHDVLERLACGESRSVIAREEKISTSTVRLWEKDKERIYAWYEKQYPPKGSGCHLFAQKRYTLEEKALVLLRIKYGESKKDVAAAMNINPGTISTWLNNQESILDVYFRNIENRPHAEEMEQGSEPSLKAISKRLRRYENGESDLEVADMAGKGKMTLEERNLRKENEYLRTKVAYLETLLELNGTPSGNVKKKLDSKRSTCSAAKENSKT